MIRILITDPLLRKTFDVVNILLSKVDVKSLVFIYFESRNFKKTKKIYKGSNIHHVREEHFSEDLYKLSKKYEDDKIIYIPIEESTTIKFYEFIEIYGSQNFLFKLPEIDSFILSRNKDELNRFCEINKIPCPKYYSEKDNSKGNNSGYPEGPGRITGSVSHPHQNNGTFRYQNCHDYHLDHCLCNGSGCY